MTPWGAYPWGAGTASDAASVAGKAAGAGLSALTTASTIAGAGGAAATAGTGAVGTLLATAGISSTVPVAGWIAAGGLAAAAGTIAFVKAMRSGKLRRSDAVARARSMGVAEAADAPAFTVKALKLAEKNPGKLVKLGERLEHKSGRKGLLGLGRGHKANAKLDSKLRIVGAVLALRMAEKRGREAPAVPIAQLEAEHGFVWKDPRVLVPFLLFSVSLTVLLVAQSRGRRKRLEVT